MLKRKPLTTLAFIILLLIFSPTYYISKKLGQVVAQSQLLDLTRSLLSISYFSSRFLFLHISTYIVSTYLYSYLFIYQQLPPFGLRPHCRRLSTSLSYPKMNGEEAVPDPDITLIVDFRCTTGRTAKVLIAR